MSVRLGGGSSGGGGGGVSASFIGYRSSNQSIPRITTTAISWNAEVEDDGVGHDLVTNPERIPVTAGLWLIETRIVFDYGAAGDDGGAQRYIEISTPLANTLFPNTRERPITAIDTVVMLSTVMRFAEDTYFVVNCFHDRATSALNVYGAAVDAAPSSVMAVKLA